MNIFADLRLKIGDIQEVVLAVLGAPAVGKSTFVRCALDLKRVSVSPVSSKKVSLEGQISIVRLVELGLEDLHITADHNILWPTKVGDQVTPVIDGVLALYDVLDKSTINHIPALISESLRSQKQGLCKLDCIRVWPRFPRTKP